MNDSRIQTAIEAAQAAIVAMEQARRDIGELINENAAAPVQLTYASVDLGSSISRATGAVHDLKRARGAA